MERGEEGSSQGGNSRPSIQSDQHQHLTLEDFAVMEMRTASPHNIMVSRFGPQAESASQSCQMTESKSKDLYSIILPTYNERENLPLITYLISKTFDDKSVSVSLLRQQSALEMLNIVLVFI